MVTVRGRGSGRVNIAGLTGYRPAHRSRLFYRLLAYHGRKNEKKGFGWTDCRDLLAAANQFDTAYGASLGGTGAIEPYE